MVLAEAMVEHKLDNTLAGGTGFAGNTAEVVGMDEEAGSTVGNQLAC